MSNTDINGDPIMRRVVLSSHKTSYKNKKVSTIPLQQTPQPNRTQANFDSQKTPIVQQWHWPDPTNEKIRTLEPEGIILTSINYFKMWGE